MDHDEKFKIDTNEIILAGSSAGAEVVLNMVYVYDTPDLDSNLNFGGVIGMAGAITSLDKISIKTTIPTQLFHGTGDKLVPYDFAPHHYCDSNKKGYLLLYGSASIARRLKGLGSPYYLYSIYGGGHRWAGLPMTRCFNEILDFLYYDVVLKKTVRQTERIVNDLQNE